MSDNSESWWNMSLLLCQPWLLHFLSEMLCFDSRFAPMSLDMHQISASTAKTATPMPVTKVGGATLDISQPFLFFCGGKQWLSFKIWGTPKGHPFRPSASTPVFSQPFPYFHDHFLMFTTISLFSQPCPYFRNHFFIFATISNFSQQVHYFHNHLLIFKTIPYVHTDLLIFKTIFAIFTTIFAIFSTIRECPIKS